MSSLSLYLNVIKGLVNLKLKYIFNIRIKAGIINSLENKIFVNQKGKGTITIGNKNKFHRNISIKSSGDLYIGSRCEFMNDVDLQANSGQLVISDGVFINSGSLIVACDRVVISEGTAIGSGVKIYDHDHVISSDGPQHWNQTVTDSVYIGKNCWIGANSIILKGSCIGDNCVIGAGSIIKGNIPEKSKVIQKRETFIIPLD